MERNNRVADKPEIEAKNIFSQVIDFEFNLINCISKGKFILPNGVTEDEYYKRLLKEYVKLFLDRAKIIEKRNNK